ncbi:DUF1080 domain-containing protein [Candidatus Poribacteria bacterium]|nr:DUF1080 domain-containing protein [Candidatus Poribacteria bacterium]
MKFTFILFFILFVTPVWSGLLIDDFNDGDFNGWSPHNCTPGMQCGEWSVNNGVLHYMGSAQRTICYLTIGEDNWTDYTVTCKARMLQELRPGSFSRIMLGIHMQSEPGTNHIYYVFGPSLGAVTVGIGVLNGGGNENWAFADIEMGRWYELKAEVVGTDYLFYIDDELVVSHKINMLPSGKIGLGCCGAEIEFDDVIIMGDNIPDLDSNLSVDSDKILSSLWSKIKHLE